MQVGWEGEGGGVGKRGAELAQHRRSGQPIPGSVASEESNVLLYKVYG